MRSLVVGVDVGIKNLGLCAYDFVSSQVVHWANVSLVPNGRYLPANNVQYVCDFIEAHCELFADASVVVVERQMRCNMRIIEAILQTVFRDKCTIINPRCVKMHYDLSTRNYRANKARAVEWSTQFLESNPSVFVETLADSFRRIKKQDDLADSLLLVMFYLDTYSNQLQ